MSRPTVFSDIKIQPPGPADRDSGPVGGILRQYTAGAALLVGDAVFLSGANTVNKSTTASNYVGFVGFVESGDALDMNSGFAVGTAAAASGQIVLVREVGIARGIAGVAGFTAGTDFNAVPSAATAGRVIAGTTAGQRLGVVLTTAIAGAEVRILIKHF